MNQRGFTLVEMLVVLLVFGILIAIIFPTFLLNWEGFDNQTERLSLWQESEDIINRITKDVYPAEDIEVNDQNNRLEISLPSGQSVTYTIKRDENILQRKESGNSKEVLSKNINPTNSKFQLGDATNSSVIVELQLETDVFGKRVSINNTTEICRRVAQ